MPLRTQDVPGKCPPEVQLAVDLIELLETNHIAPALALAALAIVRRDYERKLEEGREA
ncbi:DUF2496 domain-containing protein [Aeromonas caviae]|nr:DUF2496 domain-containing protein [Aeromonas caviae]